MQSIASRNVWKRKAEMFPAAARLALWQMRLVWRIFLLVALGMIAAVVLVGATPLFAKVNATASVRLAFTSTGLDPSSYAQASIEILDPSAINQTLQQFKQDYHQQGGPFFKQPPDASIQLAYTLVYGSNSNVPLPGQLLAVRGFDTGHIASHVHLVQGRLPQTTSGTASNVLEIALTEDTAAALEAHIGSIYTIPAAQSYTPPQAAIPIVTAISFSLKVVGILRNLDATAFIDDPFWHGNALNYQPPAGGGPAHASVIASNAGMLAFFQRVSQSGNQSALLQFPSRAYLYDYFPLDISAITSDNISTLQSYLDYFNNQEPSQFTGTFVDNIIIDNSNLAIMNANTKDLASVVQVPLFALLGLMVGLILFFITLMTELLVTRQAEAIAVMRSRGATTGQIFLVFVVQSLLLALLTLFIGPLLIPPIIRAMVTALFPPASQSALSILPTTLWGTLVALGWYVWIVMILVIVTMYLAVWRTLRNSTLGRSTTSLDGQRPLWQRVYADVVVALLGVLTYGLYTYLASSGFIDAQLQVILAAPCMLIAATLLCLAAMLLSLRFFPQLIQWCAKMAARRPGVVPLFSLVMMARAPRQAIRTTLLLIFTIAFALFSQVFLATQLQRVVDVSSYAMPADVSGFVPLLNTFDGTIEQQEAPYRSIPGVLSATLASVSSQSFLAGGTTPLPLTVVATDPSSIGNSITWPYTDNVASLKASLGHLADQRATLTANLVRQQQNTVVKATPPPIPAIVSVATSNLLHLSIGKLFFMADAYSNKSLAFIDSGEVSYLPGVPNILEDQGILVDYTSFNAAYNIVNASGLPLTLTNAWFHTQQGTASLTKVLHTLSVRPFQLTSLTSHQQILTTLQDDPLFLNLLCVLGLGIGLALLLAWIGCLASAWSHVRTRLRSLLVLRALGSTPAQLALLLCWEQILIYATAIVLGIAYGASFTALTLPQMVFSSGSLISEITGVPTLNLFQLQSTPPLQIAVPPTVLIGLGVIVLLCTVGIALTATMVLRLSPAQMLRLSEDYVEEAPVRSEKQKAQVETSNHEERSGKRPGLKQALALGRALTPVRRSWSTLGLTQLGVLIAVLFVCVVPLFSQVAATAGLRDILVLPENRTAVVTNNPSDAIPLGQVQAALTQGTKALNKTLLGQAGTYFHTAPTITLNNTQIIQLTGTLLPSTAGSNLTFASISAQALPNQVQLLQGQLPQQVNGAGGKLPILLTPQAANYLHAHVGDVLTRAQGYPLDMQLVGIFQPRSNATLLQSMATNFFYYNDPHNLQSGAITALTSTEGLAVAFDSFGRTQPSGRFILKSDVIWTYPIDEQVTSLQLDDLITTISSFPTQQDTAQFNRFTLSAIKTPLDALQLYQQSVVVSNIPILSLSVLIIALMLLFLNFMIGLLVEREANAIAILRSRGATQRQIFAAFLKRALLINGIGWLAGMALAIPVTIVLTRLTLQPQDQSGLFLLSDHPWQTFWSLVGFASASTVVTLLTMGLMLSQATRSDYLSLRRELTRETRKALWQRWYLDIVGIIIALLAYGFSLYLTNANILDPEVNVQVKSPLILTATLFLMLACTLVLLRLFPLLLRMGTKLATRNEGVESMLALSYIAHAPRQRLRTALLLLLTTTFVVFVVIFNASQTQHISDTAQYWAGADFSGSLPITSPATDQPQKEVHAYQQVKGVTSVTLGDMEAMQSNTTSMQMLAVVDLKSFMHTVKWRGLNTMTPEQQQTLSSDLSDPLQSPDLSNLWQATAGFAIPGAISTTTAQKLGVQPGQTFTVSGALGLVDIFVVAEINNIPSTDIIASYSMYNLVYAQVQASNPTISSSATPNAPINYIWIATDGHAQSLQHVRQALNKGPLSLPTFYDREATALTLTHNPLNLNLVGILVLGTCAPLLLTWIGCLMASLIEIRQRQLLFGVLRALGSTPAQLARVLSWEQALIFGTSVVLGALFGLLTAFLVMPSLVLISVLPTLSAANASNVASGVQDLFSLQNNPAAYTVIPLAFGVVVALLLALALLAVVLMMRSALNIALGQTLRLNED